MGSLFSLVKILLCLSFFLLLKVLPRRKHEKHLDKDSSSHKKHVLAYDSHMEKIDPLCFFWKCLLS